MMSAAMPRVPASKPLAADLETLTIRLALLDDAEQLWSWRNDPDTRRASHSTDAITRDQYMRWFKRCLSRNDSIILIAELHREAIGTVRFDKRRDSCLEVIINIAPYARSKKLGAPCLREACNFVLKKKAAGFRAEIRQENTASIRIFQQCGFREFGSKGGFCCSDAIQINDWEQVTASRGFRDRSSACAIWS